MKILLPDTWPQLITATISQWRPLLQNNKYKDILVDSLRFLVNENRIILDGFVIMSNDMHGIWQAVSQISPAGDNSRPGLHGQRPLQNVQQSFMKFTAQQIKFDLIKNDPKQLELYKVNAHDRHYHFWKRRSLGIELFSPAVFQQKLDYIHNNPVRAGLCDVPENYYYSSAKFYQTGIDHFNMITHYDG